MKRSCITIDRQFGSGGREVGRILSQRLGIPFYDGELLLIAAERFGLNPGVLMDKDERRTGSLLHDIALFADGLQNYSQQQEPYRIFEAVSTTIRRLSLEGPAIFIGRCADTVLKDAGGSYNVFIYASVMEERINRVHETDRIDLKHIESYIKKREHQRKEYCRLFAEMEWGKMENYDICLNTSTLGYEGCADLICAMADCSDNNRKRESI